MEGLQSPHDRMIVAYDDMTWPEITDAAQEIGSIARTGKTTSAHIRTGSDHAVNQLNTYGQAAMLDYKFHDIPSTVERSVKEATLSRGSFITVHASGGYFMLEGAVRGVESGRAEIKKTSKKLEPDKLGLVLGITVLTSLNWWDCESIFGIPHDEPEGIQKKVLQFANMANDAGLDGIVCSPLEARALRNKSKFDDLLIVTPGIRPKFANQAGDQERTATAEDAMRDGADMIVVGRGIIKANLYNMSKSEAVYLIAEEIKAGLGV